MTPKQGRFIAEYLIDLNATQAAIRAGYGKKNANVVGPRLLVDVGIQQAIAVEQAKRLQSNELSAARVLEELRRIGFSDARGFWDASGKLIPIHQLTAEQGACLAGFEAVIKNAAAGDGVTDLVHKLKFWDKGRALELLAKHFGLLTEQVAHQGEIRISWEP